jgi:hypothetical protein
MKRTALCLPSLLAAIAACSDSSSVRAPAPIEDDAGRPSLPPTNVDASAPIDAAPQRPPFDPNDEPVVCATTPCAVQIVAGERHFCARMNDGTARCWGDNSVGSLGVVDVGEADAGWRTPTVAGLAGATQLSAGGTTTCALVSGAVQCWGGNDQAQLGLQELDAPIADGDPHPTPNIVTLESTVTRVDVGPASACALHGTGGVSCWGVNTKKQLARAAAGAFGAPASAELGALAVARTASGSFSGFAVTTTGEIVSWGAVAGAEGSISARESSISTDPRPLPIGLGSVTSFAVSSTFVYRPAGFPMPPPQGIGHACAVSAGELFCWGATFKGALGSGFATPTLKPRRAVMDDEKAWPQLVVTAGDLSCVRLTDGTVQCAGDNAFGALGQDAAIGYATIFTPTSELRGHVVALAAAAQAVCALMRDGSVSCWGTNAHGELGQGSLDDAAHPAPVVVRF